MSEAAEAAASLKPGHGHLDLFGYADLDRVGGGLDAAHAVTRNIAAFARGWVGKTRGEDDRFRTDAGALAGLRVHW